MNKFILVQGSLVHLVPVIDDQVDVLLYRSPVFLNHFFPGGHQQAFIPVIRFHLVIPEYQEPVDPLGVTRFRLGSEAVDRGLQGSGYYPVIIVLIGK